MEGETADIITLLLPLSMVTRISEAETTYPDVTTMVTIGNR